MTTIGVRVREARAQQGMSQSRLAAAVGLDQSAVSRIETGDRAVATHELFDLAEALGTTTGALLGQSEATPALALAARLDDGAEEGSVAAAKERARQILEASDLLARLVGPLPHGPVLAVQAGVVRSPHRHGEALAHAAREALRLGPDAPVPDLAAILEQRLAVHVAFEPLASGTHGLCAATPGAAVVLINSADSFGRQRYTLAHELGHLLVGDLVDDVEVTRDGVKTHSEKRADSFAAHFLLPDSALRQFVGDRTVDAAVAGEIVHYFGVSLQAACWRLYNAGLIREGEREALLRRGLGGVSVAAGLLDDLTRLRDREGHRQAPRRLLSQAVEAFESGTVGVGLVADVAGTDDLAVLRDRLRQIGHAPAAEGHAAAVSLA